MRTGPRRIFRVLEKKVLKFAASSIIIVHNDSIDFDQNLANALLAREFRMLISQLQAGLQTSKSQLCVGKKKCEGTVVKIFRVLAVQISMVINWVATTNPLGQNDKSRGKVPVRFRLESANNVMMITPA